MKSLSIIVPCYNEILNIPLLVERFKKLTTQLDFELVIVNNGSTDYTANLLSQISKKYAFIKVVEIKYNIGYGHGITAGLKQASGSLLAWTHADLQTDPEDIISAYDMYTSASGNRVVKGRRSGRTFIDVFFTQGMSFVATIIFQKKFYDINAQPKLFDRQFYALLKEMPVDFSLDLYWLYIAQQYNYTILDIPVMFHKRIHGESKSSPNLRKKIKFAKTTFTAMRELKTLSSRKK